MNPSASKRRGNCRQCDFCRYGMELDDRYDQVQCVNPMSPNYRENVEGTDTCEQWEAEQDTKNNRAGGEVGSE
jgi:hypothetical protein